MKQLTGLIKSWRYVGWTRERERERERERDHAFLSPLHSKLLLR